jgi:glycerol-3-phosphate O-acyltransferase
VNLGAGRDIDEQDLLTKCLRLGRQWSLQHRITEESVSGEMFSTAVKMARHRGLLDPERPTDEVANGRATLVAELDELQGSIGELARMRRDSARL